jgi:hypothetical protein
MRAFFILGCSSGFGSGNGFRFRSGCGFVLILVLVLVLVTVFLFYCSNCDPASPHVAGTRRMTRGSSASARMSRRPTAFGSRRCVPTAAWNSAARARPSTCARANSDGSASTAHCVCPHFYSFLLSSYSTLFLILSLSFFLTICFIDSDLLANGLPSYLITVTIICILVGLSFILAIFPSTCKLIGKCCR